MTQDQVALKQRSLSPRIAIVAAAKQEARYIVEWIAYHRIMGVKSFVIGDNGGSDGTSELLCSLHNANIIERLDWLGAENFQLSFYDYAVPKLCGLADFCALIDVDEFLRPLNGQTDIPSALLEISQRPAVSAVALNYAIYGSSDLQEGSSELVLQRFKRRAPQDFRTHHIMKSLVRPERFIGMPSSHEVFVDRGEYVNDAGETWVRTEISWRALRVDHYIIKSREEFKEKSARGVALDRPGVRKRDDSFFRDMDQNEVEDAVSGHLLAQIQGESDLIKRQCGL